MVYTKHDGLTGYLLAKCSCVAIPKNTQFGDELKLHLKTTNHIPFAILYQYCHHVWLLSCPVYAVCPAHDSSLFNASVHVQTLINSCNGNGQLSV